MNTAVKLAVTAAVGTTILAGCGSSTSDGSSPTTTGASAAATALTVDSKAADLRTRLNYLLGEHLILAAKAVDAALGARQVEFASYGSLLNANGTDIGDMVGAAFGDDAKAKFNAIWSAHNGFFVDYTTGVARKDEAMKTKAVSNLTTVYIPQFSDLIAGATGLPTATVADLTRTHVLTTKEIVDKLGAKDYPGAYTALRAAYAHMQMIGNPLGEAIADKKPDLFPGDARNKGVDLRVNLDELLQEHLYLATMATGAALGGRTDEFSAAGSALNSNGTDIGAAIGTLYGDAAATKFNAIWSAHNGFFVDYTTGVARKDEAMKTKAVDNLTSVYIPQFSDFISGATGLPRDAVSDLTKMHVLTTKDVVDAQAADRGATTDVAGAAAKDRMAAAHMQTIGDPLAKAIVAKLPDKFGG